MPTEIQAAVLWNVGGPLSVETVTLADPGPREVRIELAASGICHSDLNFIFGKTKSHIPIVLGHEGFGKVVETGSEVTELAVGDTVMPYLIPDCGVCELCRSGLTNVCERMNLNHAVLAPTPLRARAQQLARFVGTATFAQQTVVHEDQVVKVDERADPSLACCLACGYTTGLGAVLKTASVRPGSAVVIFGAGGVGLGAVQGAKRVGASRIIVVDTNPDKERVARELGATEFLDARAESLVEDVRTLTGRGVQYAFECAGRTELYRTALAMLDRSLGGMLVGVGVLPPDDQIVLSPSDLRGVTIKRTLMGSAKRQDVASYVDWFVDGSLVLDGVVSHHLALSEINHGIDLLVSGEAVRVVLDCQR